MKGNITERGILLLLPQSCDGVCSSVFSVGKLISRIAIKKPGSLMCFYISSALRLLICFSFVASFCQKSLVSIIACTWWCLSFSTCDAYVETHPFSQLGLVRSSWAVLAICCDLRWGAGGPEAGDLIGADF